MDALALKQLDEELLYMSVCEGKAEYVQGLLEFGVSPTARINLPSNLRLLNQRYTHEITLETVNKYWAGYLNPEVFLNEVDDDLRDWEYSEKEPKIIVTAGLHNPVIARLLVEKSYDEILDNKHVLVEAVESWLLMPDTQERTEDDDILRSLLYDYLHKPGNMQKLNMALVVCAGKPTGSQAVTQLLARGADPNYSLLDEVYRDASTPLVAACRCASLENVKVLLDTGADPNLEAQSGIIPSVATFASFGFHQELLDRQRVFDLLRQYDPELRTSSTRALSKPAPVFNKYGYGSRPGSVLSAVIVSRIGGSRDQIPLEFLESNGLLEHLDNYLPGDEYGTPLIAAAATGQEDFVHLLLECGATINATGHPDTEWSHPALAAIFAEHWDLALQLLEHFDASSIGIPGGQRKWSMALMVALESKNSDVALKLIDGGVNVNFAMDEGASSSILYQVKDSSDGYMGNIKSRLSERGTPLYAACVGGDPTLIKRLQELKASEKVTAAASSADCLTAVCESKQVEAVEMFLQRGDDVNKCNPGRERWCPLVSTLQSYYCPREIVSLLLEKGARANKSYLFKNPAAEPYHLETLTLTHSKSLHFSLLWKRMWDDCTITGPSILQGRPFFGTQFIAAAYGRDEDTIKLIAEQQDVDVNQEVSCGIYPTAMMATLDMKKMYRVVGPLRELGSADITISQMLNFSHPFRALDSDMVKENVGATVRDSFWGNMITLCVNVEMAIPYLLQQGADPNEVVPGSFYGSALIAASALLRPGTMVHFLEHGCDVNVVVSGSLFGTPLIAVCAGPAHYPFQWSHHEEFNLSDPPNWSMVQYDMLQMLLDRGADPNVTHNTFSPLIALVLCDCEEEYKIKSLKLLLDYKADPDITLPQWGYDMITAGKRWSAISIVKAKGQEKIEEILMQYKMELVSSVVSM
ncbi:hypothetical protein IL306_011351 [Fusarium sp. DS 682]|nr:hypothetical protein IL306_011351 [Fusarium sp. DS 682]